MTTILATDLDGTFLGGSAAEREALYRWIAANRAEVVLVYVTGRSLTTMRDVLEGLPLRPDHVIANVGTSALLGPDWSPHPEVDGWLGSRWCGMRASALARRLASEFPALAPQPVVEGRRLSYFFDERVPMAELEAVVRDAGYDPLASAGRYFDVLPRGVNKGATLLRLLDALGLPRSRTLVAGDTLNDLALFETGLRGVAVGGSEPALIERVSALPNVACASAPGAAAILPELRALHSTPPGACA